MTDKYKETRKKWDETHKQIVKESKAKYNVNNPVLSFRPTPRLLMWLYQERRQDEKGKLESISALVTRKLEKLMNIENTELNKIENQDRR